MVRAEVAPMVAVVAALCVANLIVPTRANVFLGRHDQRQAMGAMSVAARQAFLAEMNLGHEHRSFTERRLTKIEKALSPIYKAAPKNEHGLLGPPAVTYLLHRLFVLRHGWFVRGLDPEGKGHKAFNSSRAADLMILEGEHLQEVFDQRISGKGAGIYEIAMMAATLEHTVHKEAMNRLQMVYKSLSFSLEDVVSEGEAQDVFDSYMALYILGFLLPSNATSVTADQVALFREQIPSVYPHWEETRKFVQDVQDSVLPKRDYLYFSDISTVIEEIGDRYGRWQDNECRGIKDELVAIEDKSSGGAGRVRLGDFYRKAIDEGKWQFGESKDYLRQLGALDEADPANPRLLIANYVNSPSNCVASSEYYSVCCRNECEELLGHLEIQLAAPDAPSKTIAALISATPSRTVPSNRTLPEWLLKRLDEIANHHHGVVPLHGRLFLQWMHFAYPRECPYPHASGTTSPVGVDEVVKSMNEAVDENHQYIATQDHMMLHINLPQPNITLEADAMWTTEEELVVWRPEPKRELSPTLNGIMFMGSLVSVSLLMMQTLQPALRRHQGMSPQDKYFV